MVIPLEKIKPPTNFNWRNRIPATVHHHLNMKSWRNYNHSSQNRSYKTHPLIPFITYPLQPSCSIICYSANIRTDHLLTCPQLTPLRSTLQVPSNSQEALINFFARITQVIQSSNHTIFPNQMAHCVTDTARWNVGKKNCSFLLWKCSVADTYIKECF